MESTNAPRKPETERVPASEARDRLTELMNRAAFQGDAFILTRNGDDIAAIIGIERLRALNVA